jgi:hypothetical protein
MLRGRAQFSHDSVTSAHEATSDEPILIPTRTTARVAPINRLGHRLTAYPCPVLGQPIFYFFISVSVSVFSFFLFVLFFVYFSFLLIFVSFLFKFKKVIAPPPMVVHHASRLASVGHRRPHDMQHVLGPTAIPAILIAYVMQRGSISPTVSLPGEVGLKMKGKLSVHFRRKKEMEGQIRKRKRHLEEKKRKRRNYKRKRKRKRGSPFRRKGKWRRKFRKSKYGKFLEI